MQYFKLFLLFSLLIISCKPIPSNNPDQGIINWAKNMKVEILAYNCTYNFDYVNYKQCLVKIKNEELISLIPLNCNNESCFMNNCK